ncbi:MAG: 50S ribosomal protein L27 [Parcubacteria group bacterium]|nr:50S ribosomal protein L27 [Parcubacteria group bacterium]
MAHTKQKGSSKNNRESESKRLGVKLFGGQIARPGNIVIRQRGTKYLTGLGVRLGSDDTIYAVKEGKVQFKTKKITKFDGSKKTTNIVSVI